jgi:carbon-monoxide dehydrogenase catalytic subunit
LGDDTTKQTVDPAALHILTNASESGYETAWDRYESMLPLCDFGERGLCCRHCLLGPCRIDPFGEGPQAGICGINAHGMVARNLCVMVAVGASAHSDHGSHMLEVLKKVHHDEVLSYQIRSQEKLDALYAESGEVNESDRLAGVIEAAWNAFGQLGGETEWLIRLLPVQRVEKLRRLKLLPSGIDSTIRETLHRTHMGVDADHHSLLMAALKCSLADFVGMDVSSSISDVLLGIPTPTRSTANLGVLDSKAVNVAVHGHNPLVSESILEAVPEMEERARRAGASGGINVVGVCCTGNEVLMRRGVPLATNSSSQELAVITGVIEAMVVDVQCIMPSLSSLCSKFHTEFITTSSIARIPGARHIEMTPLNSVEAAREILELAIEAYGRREPKKIDIPNERAETLVGFSSEAILSVLSQISPEDPLGPLVNLISEGAIYGVVLFAGCNNYKVPQDSGFLYLAEKLAADNVLLLATGCASGAFAKCGYLSPKATREICGTKLAGVLTELGRVAGLDEPLPPVWHMGSCVDNSRPHRLVFALAKRLGVDVDQLPVVASAPEAMSEKSISIGMGAVALGLTTHLGVSPPVKGSNLVTRALGETLQELVGAHFIIETEPLKAYDAILETIRQKRAALGLLV